MIRLITTSEPLWTDEDRLLLLALAAEEAEQCDCGHPLEVSTDPTTQRTWRVDSITCEACRVLEATVGNDAEARKRGVKYSVVRAV